MTQMWPPAAPPARRGHSATIRVLVAAVVALLVAGYAAVAYVSRDRWLGGAPTEDRTSVVWTATGPDGVAPSQKDLDRTREVLQGRADDLGDAEVSLDGTTVTVRVAGGGESEVRDLSQPGRLYLRPVIHAIPVQGQPAPRTPARKASAQQITDERDLRQSTDQNVQVLALQFQSTRCGEDLLAGEDDPELPLVTCSQDGQEVYLLDTSFIDGDQIKDSSATFDDQLGQYVIDVEFAEVAAKLWADFTAASIGTQVAFTLDTGVVSAPAIREAIPNGRTQIAGSFTESQAKTLASVLGHGYLPLNLTVESSDVTAGPPAPASIPTRVALAATGLLLTLLVIVTVVYLVVAGRRRPAEVREPEPR